MVRQRLACLAVTTVVASFCNLGAFAQLPLHFQNQDSTGQQLVHLMQGESRELAPDFTAQLDGDKLRVSLEKGGLVSAMSNDQMVISLIQPNRPRQAIRPIGNSEVVFQNVQTGLAAVVVTADSLANTSFSSVYAAVPVFLTNAPGGATAPLAVPLAEIPTQEIATGVSSATSTGAGDSQASANGNFGSAASSRYHTQRMADGSVEGRVIVPATGAVAVPGKTQITLYRNAKVVSQTVSDAEGNFVLPNVPVGVNSLVANGSTGHAAYHIHVTDAAELVNPVSQKSNKSGVRLVSRVNQPGSLQIYVIPSSMMDDVRDAVNDPSDDDDEEIFALGEPLPGAPGMGPAPGGFPGGAPAGGGFGGGAGGGGFGGAGGAAGLAALAAGAVGIAAASDDDDGFNVNLATRIAP